MGGMWTNFGYDGNPNGAYAHDTYLSEDTELFAQMLQNVTGIKQSLSNVNVTGITRPYWPHTMKMHKFSTWSLRPTSRGTICRD